MDKSKGSGLFDVLTHRNLDIFVGPEIDLVGITGVEASAGIVIDVDHPLESGIYGTIAVGGGMNVGGGIGGGYAFGDIEGTSTQIDVNAGEVSGFGGYGDDGTVVVGGSYGPGIGGSVSYGKTKTLSIAMVVDWFVSWFD